MAELALGIVPLCIAIVKGGSVVLGKLKQLRKRDSELARLRTHFLVQRHIFLEECESLFQQFLDDEVAHDIVKDVPQPTLDEAQMENRIWQHLGELFDAFEGTMKSIYETIDELDKSLNATIGDSQHPEVKLKGLEVPKQAVDIIRHKLDYQATIEEFRICNHDLKGIRKMAAKRGNQRAMLSPQPRTLPSLPSSYRNIAQCSESFHRALNTLWTCRQKQHTDHEARLLLEPRSDSRLRVVVRYQTGPEHRANDIWVDFVIRSGTQEQVYRPTPTSAQTSDSILKGGKSKGVELRGEHSTVPSRVYGSSGPSYVPTSAKSINLGECGDLCAQLCKQTMSTRYTSYFDSTDQVRHLIHPVCDDKCDHKGCLNQKAVREPAKLDSIFGCTPEQSRFGINQQLRLALKLVNATLQFASTPWLRALWYLKDLSYFQTDGELATALATLHTSYELSESSHDEISMVDLSEKLLETQRWHGVSNLTLYSLGMALLQIGRWSPLSTDDIGEVRRIAECNSALGPVYERLTQQCLDCNFASGKDLSDPELQDAVYRDVVCKLEKIINIIEGN